MAIKNLNIYSETEFPSHTLQCSLPANIRRANHIAVALWLTAGAPPATRGSRVKGRQCRFTVTRRKVPRDVHKCPTIHIVYRIANPIYHNSRTIITQITYCTDCMLLLQIPKIVRCNVADIWTKRLSSFNFNKIWTEFCHQLMTHYLYTLMCENCVR